jgi:hypothetical protein
LNHHHPWGHWGQPFDELRNMNLDVEIDIGNIKKKESRGTKPKDAKD